MPGNSLSFSLCSPADLEIFLITKKEREEGRWGKREGESERKLLFQNRKRLGFPKHGILVALWVVDGHQMLRAIVLMKIMMIMMSVQR